jgi:nucleotide-binding universal stress UspA family protein
MKNLANRLRLTLAARHRGDVTINTRVVQGSAPEVLDRLARAFGADLLVVGRRGMSRIRDLIMGTTARRLLRFGRLPVLVVTRPPEKYRTAVVGFDFSPESMRAGRLARRLMPYRSTLIAVHGLEDPYRDLPPELVPASPDRREAMRHVARLLRRLVQKVGSGGNPWQIITKDGDPRRALLETAAGKNADLIAVGSSGKSRIARTLMGSVAEEVLDRARCDILLVRRKSRQRSARS